MAFDPQKLIKSIKDGIRLNRRNNRPMDDEDEDEKDDSPGDVNLEGQHKGIYGINKRLIGGVVLFGVLVYAFSTFIFSEEEPQTNNKPTEYDVSAAKKTSGMGETENKEQTLTYQDLRNRNQQNQNRAEASPMSPNLTPEQQTALQAQQQASRPVPTPSVPTAQPSGNAARDTAASIEAQRQAKLEQELEQRYKSAIDFAIGSRGQQVEQAVAMGETGTASGGLGVQGQSASLQTASVSYSTRGTSILQVGTMIPAMLFSGINTDTPGQVIAQVSRDVYDSATGTNLLIPSGTQLIGSAQNGSKETGRIGVTFTTMILPNGDAYDVGSALIAVDGGYNGIQGKVHRHTSRMITAGVLTSAIAALGSYASGDTSGNNSYTGGQLMMQGAQANLINSISNLFSQATNVQPTITIEPGYTFYVYVTQPISFK